MTYSSEVLADTPLVYARLGETAGATAVDSSGNGRDGTYTGGSIGQPGLLTSDPDKALVLSAAGHVGWTSSAWMDGLTSFTTEVWIKFTSAVDTTNGDALASRYGSSGFQWLLWRTTGNKFGIQAQIGGSFKNCNGTTTPALNTTYHVVGTWDGSNLRIYVNGVLENTVAASGALATSTQAMEIGRYSAATVTTPNATFDEYAFYGAALSGTRVTAHHTVGTSSDITISGEPFVTAATMLDGTAIADVVISGEPFTCAATMLDGSALTDILIDGEPFVLVTVMVDGNVDGAPILIDGESWVAAATFLDGSVSQNAGTDVSNRGWARRRGGIGLVTVEVPVAPVPPTRVAAARVTKAVPLPTPTMDDGRPT